MVWALNRQRGKLGFTNDIGNVPPLIDRPEAPGLLIQPHTHYFLNDARVPKYWRLWIGDIALIRCKDKQTRIERLSHLVRTCRSFQHFISAVLASQFKKWLFYYCSTPSFLFMVFSCSYLAPREPPKGRSRVLVGVRVAMLSLTQFVISSMNYGKRHLLRASENQRQFYAMAQTQYSSDTGYGRHQKYSELHISE